MNFKLVLNFVNGSSLRSCASVTCEPKRRRQAGKEKGVERCCWWGVYYLFTPWPHRGLSAIPQLTSVTSPGDPPPPTPALRESVCVCVSYCVIQRSLRSDYILRPQSVYDDVGFIYTSSHLFRNC